MPTESIFHGHLSSALSPRRAPVIIGDTDSQWENIFHVDDA
jgi:hypothetical protein